MKTSILKTTLAIVCAFTLAGCTFIFQKGRQSDVEKIESLNQQVNELASAKDLLEQQLAQEIKDKQVKLEMMEKGLVITFLTDILFDPGKAKIKPEMNSTLDKVAKVLNENVVDLSVGIEGHTDNQPIKYSGWKSNWELSTARALSVLHYLVDEKGVAPQRVSAIGYGEYRPVEANTSVEGQKANRRVEVVILPPAQKVKEGQAVEEKKETPQEEEKEMAEPKENLK
jgi:chemotaxis protein MotB